MSFLSFESKAVNDSQDKLIGKLISDYLGIELSNELRNWLVDGYGTRNTIEIDCTTWYNSVGSHKTMRMNLNLIYTMIEKFWHDKLKEKLGHSAYMHRMWCDLYVEKKFYVKTISQYSKSLVEEIHACLLIGTCVCQCIEAYLERGLIAFDNSPIRWLDVEAIEGKDFRTFKSVRFMINNSTCKLFYSIDGSNYSLLSDGRIFWTSSEQYFSNQSFMGTVWIQNVEDATDVECLLYKLEGLFIPRNRVRRFNMEKLEDICGMIDKSKATFAWSWTFCEDNLCECVE